MALSAAAPPHCTPAAASLPSLSSSTSFLLPFLLGRRRRASPPPAPRARVCPQEEPSRPADFEALLRQMDFTDVLDRGRYNEIEPDSREHTENALFEYYQDMKLIHSYCTPTPARSYPRPATQSRVVPPATCCSRTRRPPAPQAPTGAGGR